MVSPIFINLKVAIRNLLGCIKNSLRLRNLSYIKPGIRIHHISPDKTPKKLLIMKNFKRLNPFPMIGVIGKHAVKLCCRKNEYNFEIGRIRNHEKTTSSKSILSNKERKITVFKQSIEYIFIVNYLFCEICLCVIVMKFLLIFTAVQF